MSEVHGRAKLFNKLGFDLRADIFKVIVLQASRYACKGESYKRFVKFAHASFKTD